MSVFQAAVLGLVQGLCEFLPVSSSGHLVLMQKLFGLEEGAMFFSTMLHLGTLFAVIIVFRHTIGKMLRHPTGKLLRYIVLATLPTVAITLLLKDFFDSAYGGGLLGWGFLITSLILFLTEKLCAKGRAKELDEMKPWHALTIGTVQGLAVLPGVSRSGSTISAALCCGLERSFAAEFSFLMSIPAILGAVVLNGYDAFKEGLGNIEWLPVIVGMAVAFVTGWFAISWMLKIVKKGKLAWFAVYTTAVGVLILLDQYVFHLFF